MLKRIKYIDIKTSENQKPSENQKNPGSTELKVNLLQNIWALDYIYGEERHDQHMLVRQNSEIRSNTIFELKNTFTKVAYDQLGLN